MPNDLFDVLPPQDRERAQNLRNYIRVELANSRTPRMDAVRALEMFNDAARDRGGVPQGMIQNAPPAPAQTPSRASYTPAQQQTADLVNEAAQISVALEIAAANGIKPRPQDVQRLGEIDSMARARLSPQQYADANRHFAEAKVKAHADFEVMQITNHNNMAETTRREEVSARAKVMSAALRGVSGDGKMSVELEDEGQLKAFRAGEAVTQRTGKATFPKAALAKQIKTKYGTSYNEHLKRLDEVAEMELSNPTGAARKREAYGFDAKTTKDWRQGEGIRLGLAERAAEREKDEPEFEDVQPTKADERHMDMHTAAAEHDEYLAEQTTEDFREDNRALLEEDSLHGTVARSFITVEEHHERNNQD